MCLDSEAQFQTENNEIACRNTPAAPQKTGSTMRDHLIKRYRIRGRSMPVAFAGFRLIANG
jgi:hypothetical protein